MAKFSGNFFQKKQKISLLSQFKRHSDNHFPHFPAEKDNIKLSQHIEKKRNLHTSFQHHAPRLRLVEGHDAEKPFFLWLEMAVKE